MSCWQGPGGCMVDAMQRCSGKRVGTVWFNQICCSMDRVPYKAAPQQRSGQNLCAPHPRPVSKLLLAGRLPVQGPLDCIADGPNFCRSKSSKVVGPQGVLWPLRRACSHQVGPHSKGLVRPSDRTGERTQLGKGWKLRAEHLANRSSCIGVRAAPPAQPRQLQDLGRVAAHSMAGIGQLASDRQHGPWRLLVHQMQVTATR